MSASTKPETQQPEADQQQMQAEHPNAKTIAILREQADWLERNAWTGWTHMDNTIRIYAITGAELREMAKKMPRQARKAADDAYFSVISELPNGAVIQLYTSRNCVCECVQVGEKVVPAKPECIIPAIPEHTEPVYEWKCPESILRPETETVPTF